MSNSLELGKKVIKDKIPLIPKNPGVYKMLGATGEILYIGKAKNLKNRIKSYLNFRKGEGKRIGKLKSSIKYIETIITKTESDALILEQGLISYKDLSNELMNILKSKRDEIIFKMKITSKDEFEILLKRVEILEKKIDQLKVKKKKKSKQVKKS